MKKLIINFYLLFKKALYDDVLDRYLLLTGLVLSVLDFIVWRTTLTDKDLFVFLRVNIYPVKFLAVVLVLNTLLTVAAHDNEKEVGYLLLMGNIIACLLVFVLEIFYITQLS